MIAAAINFLNACSMASTDGDNAYKLDAQIVDEMCGWVNQELALKSKPSRLRALPPDPDVLEWLRDGIERGVISHGRAAELLDMSVGEALDAGL